MSICENCIQGKVLPGEPKGTIQPNGAYFIPGPSEQTGPKKVIVLLTDVFGLPLKNSKILADRFSEQVGCDVWVPDLFAGNPPVGLDQLDFMPDQPGIGYSWMGKLQFFWIILTRFPSLIAARSSVIDPRIQNLIQDIEKENNYEKIGTVGYCFGGAACIRIASTGLIDSTVVVHPGRCNIEQIKAMKVPSSWACAEEDPSLGPKLRMEAEAVFAAREGKPDFIEYEFHVYKGTTHGYAARPNLALPEVKEAFEKTFDQAVNWFKKTLF